MGLRIISSSIVENNIAKAQKNASESLEKLSSGIQFTRANPMPAERAVSDTLMKKMREISSYRRNANDGVSLSQTADAALSEISNITIRLKELTTQASNPALSDKERQFLFVEYKGLYDEINRITKTTAFAGTQLLNGDNTNGSNLSFRIGSPTEIDNNDINVIKFDNIENIIANTEELGLPDVENLLSQSDGISLDDVSDLFNTDGLDDISTSFDVAFSKINSYRTQFGAVSSRLTSVLNVLDVTNENLAAANSRLRDVDYATEISNLTRANILVKAGMALLSQGFVPAKAALDLIQNAINN